MEVEAMSSKELTMYLEKELEQLKEKGLYNTIDILESENGACIIVDGKKMINLASNNYLGFANRKELKKACIEATETYGVGAGAVRTINGSLKIHQQLEEKIAEFKGTEAAIAFQSGFNCNMGAISAVMTKEDAKNFYKTAKMHNGMLQLDAKDKPHVSLYYCEDYYDYFYGTLPISSGYMKIYELKRSRKKNC